MAAAANLTRQPNCLDTEVVVVGGGISGLACASALRKEGVKVIVLEASHHLGGRIRTIREDELMTPGQCPKSHDRWLRTHVPSSSSRALGADNFGFEVGAEFVHGRTTPLNELLNERKVRLQELFTWAHGDGGPSEKPAPDGGMGMYWMGKEQKLLRFDEKDADLDAMHEALWTIGDLSRGATHDDTRTLRQYLSDEGVSDRAVGMAEAGYANTVCGTLDKIGLAQMAQCERNWFKDGEGDFRVEGTLNETVIPALAEGLDVRTSSAVKQISHVGERVTVSIMGGTSIVAAAVVVTVPIPVLQRGIIKFTPPLSDLKQKALSSLECEPALKIHAKFTSRVWPHNLHGMVCSDDFAPEIWFDKHQAADGTSVFYCTAFFTSDQARAISALETADAFHRLLDQINRMFKTSCDKFFCGGFICDWGAVPYIWGGYTVPSKKELPNAREIVRTPIDRIVFFAGEGTDPYGYMTAHAAMSSGVSAACDVLQTVITSRIKSVLPLQVSGILFHATASQKQFFWTTFDAGHAPSHTRPGRHAPHALKNVVVTTARFARQDALIFAVETNTGLLCN